MRIMIVTNQFPALSEKFILDHITGLIDLGHDVSIYSQFRPKQAVKFHESVKAYKLLDKTFYYQRTEKRLRRFGKFTVMFFKYFWRYPGAFLKCLNLGKRGVYEAVETLFKFEPFFAKRYDVLHCHFGPNALPFMHVKGIIPIKFITTFHGYDISSYVQENGAHCYDELIRNCDTVLSVSNYFRERLLSLGCPLEKIRVVYSGINIDEFAYIPREFNFTKSFQILSLGRFVEKKGTRYLVEAFSEFHRKFPQSRLTLLGGGPLEAEIRQLIHGLSLDSVVDILGEVTHEEFKKHLAIAKIFVLPSITSKAGDQEGIPNVLKEAMLSGLPVIGTSHAGVPEMIEFGRTGLLVPERDAKALAKNMELLANDPQLCARLSRDGREFVIAHFDNKIINKKIEAIYQELLGRAHNR